MRASDRADMRYIEQAHSMFAYRIDARDGVAGHVRDLYFDDRRWIVRYLVADLRHGLDGRRVLISPRCARGTDPAARAIAVALTREQIWRSPDVDADRPVSRQHEAALHEYYGLPFYWKAEPPLD